MAAVIVLFNLVVSSEFLGLSYTHFDWRVYAQVYMGPENAEPGGCSDGIDNDGDGLVDCVDPDCVDDPSCPLPAPAPLLSWVATLASILLLGGLGIRAMRRKRADHPADPR